MSGRLAIIRAFAKEYRLAQPTVPETYVESLLAQIDILERALREFVECAKFDACMDGAKFMGWDRSALDRALAHGTRALDGDTHP